MYDQGLQCLPFLLHLLKAFCSSFRVIVAIFLCLKISYFYSRVDSPCMNKHSVGTISP